MFFLPHLDFLNNLWYKEVWAIMLWYLKYPLLSMVIFLFYFFYSFGGSESSCLEFKPGAKLGMNSSSANY